MKKILITGAAGFIGFHLIEKLANNNFNIVGLDNINNYYDVNLKYARLLKSGISKEKIEYNTFVLSNSMKDYRFIKLDLLDKENIFQLFKNEKFDYVINLAAQAGVRNSLENPYAYIDSNIIGFFNLLEACRQNFIKHLVYASSSSVYGANTKTPFSEDDITDFPISLYAATKKTNELMAYTYTYLYNLPVTGLRFFSVYGPWGRPDMAYFKFLKNIKKDIPIEVFNNGKVERDFTYIDDVIECLMVIIQAITGKEKNGKISGANFYKNNIYNIGNNKPRNIEDFITIIENRLGKRAIKKYLPVQPGDVLKTYADIQKIESQFNFVTKTDIESGLIKFIDWYLEFYHDY